MPGKTFYTDKQTKDDLQIVGDSSGSLVGILNRTITNGGDWALKDLINEPLRDANRIQERRDIIKYLMDNVEQLAFDKTSLDFMDHYLSRTDKPQKFSRYKAIKNSLIRYFDPTAEYYIKRRGVHETLDSLKFLAEFCRLFCEDNSIPFFIRLKDQVEAFSNEPVLASIINGSAEKLGRYDVEVADFLLRNKRYKKLQLLLADMYLLDAYYAVAYSSRKLNFVFPVFDRSSDLQIEGLYHPFLSDAVPNSISLNRETNLLFITGANMSGKSTLMKSVGLAIYMAHLGFPVPAQTMKLMLLDGLITTINLPDNINLGYSHFYSEVKRVKMVGEKINEGMKLFVMFDEFFRGTNVKDACAASVRISQAFSENKNCYFMVSTHIVEVANELKSDSEISFKYFGSSIVDNQLNFDFQLRDGISSDHIGMWILENEGVFGLLEKRAINS